MRFAHGGKFGDLIYSLPVIQHLGGGELTLYPNPATGMTFTADSVAAIEPLLSRQSYIESVQFAPGPLPGTLNLDTFRRHWRGGYNIADIVAEWLGIPHHPREAPWLYVEANRVAPVVFARCDRWRNPEFPWKKVLKKYDGNAVFVGLPHEHERFVREVGPVPFHPTADFLELAAVIAGADLFVGNQSSPRAVAEGLKRPVLQESDRSNDNCHWERRRTWYGYRSDTYIPDLEEAAR